MGRPDKRLFDELRPVKITCNYLKYPAGSVLIETGETKVLCAASIDENVPPHKKGTGTGWVTAEYSLLPGSTSTRNKRERFKLGGRTSEIQRLIGRSLRSIVDLKKLGERSILIDADVIQADGGTRTAAITGCFVALHDAIKKLLEDKKIKENPINEFLAAVSVGIASGEEILDLNYEEDFAAEVDMNVVMTESGKIVEIQGTAEKTPFEIKQLDKLVDLAAKGIKELIQMQKEL